MWLLLLPFRFVALVLLCALLVAAATVVGAVLLPLIERRLFTRNRQAASADPN